MFHHHVLFIAVDREIIREKFSDFPAIHTEWFGRNMGYESVTLELCRAIWGRSAYSMLFNDSYRSLMTLL